MVTLQASKTNIRMARIKIKVERTETGYSAYAEKYAAFTTGDTIPELVSNMVESLNFYFEDKGKILKAKDLAFEMELTSVFAVYPVLNMKALAHRLNMNHTLLSQYATGKKKPSQKQVAKILEGINAVGRELAELKLLHQVA
jgi:transcriptional regulator with XRE-family HTH domain